MSRKDRIDTFGALSLIGFSAFLGANQVIIKIVNTGLQPVFWAGLRSFGAIFCIWALMRLRGKRLDFRRSTVVAGLMIGVAFAAEFIFLFIALDLTTVTRSSVLFYSMPVWLAIAAHFLLPGEQLTLTKVIGLLIAFAGVVWAISDRDGAGGQASLVGDLCAIAAALSWGALALIARGTNIREVGPETQLMWQVCVSAPILLALSPLFGDLLRDPQPFHWWGLAVQIVLVVSVGFSIWLWLLSVYPPASVAAFSFLTPIFGVSLGWLILDEPISPALIGSLVLVIGGLMLVNRAPRQVPQKVR